MVIDRPGGVSLADLRLAAAIHEEQSIAAAATRLHLAQPSASQRLAALERRLGVRLFDRGPFGARPTVAGGSFVAGALRCLDQLEATVELTRAASTPERLAIGTFATLAAPVFAALADTLGDQMQIRQRVDHGRQLVEGVRSGSLDAAVVALPAGLARRPGARRYVLGPDRLVLVAPDDVELPPSTGRRSLRDRRVHVATYRSDPTPILDRLVHDGATVAVAVTAPTALAIARHRGQLAAVPRSAWRADRHPRERSRDLPLDLAATLSLVVARTAISRLEATVEPLRRALVVAGQS